MSTERHASCGCGQLRVTTTGEPVRISMCHCFECQRRTGSTFGVQARFTDDQVQIEGRSTEWMRTADSGNHIHFHFCPVCGSTVFYKLEALPGFTAVAVGAFADPNFPSPRVSVYEARKHSWTGIPADAEHLD
ncbi:MAG: GFA family protein [Polyangiaceae bacterium]